MPTVSSKQTYNNWYELGNVIQTPAADETGEHSSWEDHTLLCTQRKWAFTFMKSSHLRYLLYIILMFQPIMYFFFQNWFCTAVVIVIGFIIPHEPNKILDSTRLALAPSPKMTEPVSRLVLSFPENVHQRWIKWFWLPDYIQSQESVKDSNPCVSWANILLIRALWPGYNHIGLNQKVKVTFPQLHLLSPQISVTCSRLYAQNIASLSGDRFSSHHQRMKKKIVAHSGDCPTMFSLLLCICILLFLLTSPLVEGSMSE